MEKFMTKILALSFTVAMVCTQFAVSSALAALNCSRQPSCSELNYDKQISTNCPADKIIYCPFDTSYKKCIVSSVQDCTGFTLSACPSTAVSCSACGNGTNIKYKVNTCKNGYTLQDNTCATNDCSGFNLSQCPKNAVCSDCNAGNVVKYKIDSCTNNTVMNGSECYSCSEMYNKLDKALSNNLYLYCDANETWCGKDTITCDTNTSKKWNNFCICSIVGHEYCIKDIGSSKPTLPGQTSDRRCYREDETNCKLLASRMDKVIQHHNMLCPEYELFKPTPFMCSAYLPADKGLGTTGPRLCLQWQN